ncbi:MAG: ATP-binding protein [Oligoflexales bacterium]
MEAFKNKKFFPIAQKILVGTLAISSIFTIVVTALQLVLDYNHDLKAIESKFKTIEKSYSDTIALSVWNYDTDVTQSQAEGILNLPDIAYVEVKSFDQVVLNIGNKPKDRFLDHKYRLLFKENKDDDTKSVDVGEVYVIASLSGVDKKVKNKLLIILVSQFIKTFIVSFFIIVIINLIVTRHLTKIKEFLSNFDPKSREKNSVKLGKRKPLEKRKFYDDIDVLTNSINTMTLDLRNLYQSLELKVEERTQDLEKINQNINAILGSLTQGIITFGDDIRIEKEYSKFVEEIFKTRNIAGENGLDFLFNNSSITSSQLNQVNSAILGSMDEDLENFELNSHLLLKEIEKEIEGKTKVLSLEWRPIIHQEVIHKIMVVVKDETELRLLQKVAEKRKAELQMIEDILGQGISKSKQYFMNQMETLGNSIKLLSSGEANRDFLSKLFRDLHTIKGTSMTFGYHLVIEPLHETEQYLQSFLQEENSEINLNFLADKVKHCQSLFKEYFSLISLKLLVNNSENTDKKDSFTKKFDKLILESEEELMEDPRKSLIELINYRKDSLFLSIEEIIKDSQNSLSDLAKELNKPKPRVHFSEDQPLILKTYSDFLNDVFVHVFRNIMDHGIEDQESRKKAGKSRYGNVYIDSYLDQDLIIIEIKDDGKGLNLPLLANKTKTNITNDSEIAETIFSSGISTAESISKISGRGVGMDAVRHFIKEKGGNIYILFTGPKNKEGFRPFKLSISLPGKISRSYSRSKSA